MEDAFGLQIRADVGETGIRTREKEVGREARWMPRGRRGRGWIMLSSPGGGEATLQGTIFAGILLPATFRPKGEEASKEKVFFTLQARRGAGTGETGKESQMNAEPAMK